MEKKYYIGSCDFALVGIHAEYFFAVCKNPNHPFSKQPTKDNFREVTQDEYNESVLDWRFEDGFWQQ
jgi:hypothetical protein